MTNGEMIQKVFNCEVCEPIIEDDIIHVIFADKKDSAIGFDWSWWNAEYKEPTTKNDLSSELEKNSKKLEKDFGESDCISRAEVNQVIEDYMDEQYHVLSDRTRERAFGAKVVKARINELHPITPQEPRCKECKWWKDSDGAFRRGIGAESKCPINRKEVYEGNGYCFLFEPKNQSE